MSEQKNLYKEIVRVLGENGKTIDDIVCAAIVPKGSRPDIRPCQIEDFLEIAKWNDYTRGYDVDCENIIIIGDDGWWLEWATDEDAWNGWWVYREPYDDVPGDIYHPKRRTIDARFIEDCMDKRNRDYVERDINDPYWSDDDDERLTDEDREIMRNNKIKDDINRHIRDYVEEHGGWDALIDKREE